MTRGGRTSPSSDPERRCIVTGETGPKAGLIRFVVGPDDTVVPDLGAKLPGRGIWVSAGRAALEKAVAKRMFSRGAKRQVTVPEGLVDTVEAGLLARVQGSIALARKAGEAICGYEKVKTALGGSRIAALLQATDGSERGKGKLWTPEGARWIGHLSADELGQAFGRERVIHAVVAAGTLGRRVVEDAAKLKGLRGTDGGDGASGKDIGNA
ncbi:RNA-binding protein [Jannaschia sp. W003]|uniref:RNA-binding protein n=1 Tax=Jannaschia sp. W003 TaxID=2867012 RepID=UPI0021A73D34|nr:RNA-binding protein [Jannaschia sp. W003]UWQ22974.1 RNA-binding protein [Jannaschia sp. W003]